MVQSAANHLKNKRKKENEKEMSYDRLNSRKKKVTHDPVMSLNPNVELLRGCPKKSMDYLQERHEDLRIREEKM